MTPLPNHLEGETPNMTYDGNEEGEGRLHTLEGSANPGRCGEGAGWRERGPSLK